LREKLNRLTGDERDTDGMKNLRVSMDRTGAPAGAATLQKKKKRKKKRTPCRNQKHVRGKDRGHLRAQGPGTPRSQTQCEHLTTGVADSTSPPPAAPSQGQAGELEKQPPFHRQKIPRTCPRTSLPKTLPATHNGREYSENEAPQDRHAGPPPSSPPATLGRERGQG